MFRLKVLVWALLFACPVMGEDWNRFRGPGGLAVGKGSGIVSKWSEKENILWRTKLPGPGTSSPITSKDRIFVTCYSGYGVEDEKGEMDTLRLHVVCADRKSGNTLWTKTIKPVLPERTYRGFLSLHGFSSSTPATDGERLYVFFGKSGVYCFDFEGKQLWQKNLGERTHSWGSATSPVLYKDLVIVNASVESGALIALNKKTGEEVWRANDLRSSWSTPILVNVKGKEPELVLSASRKIIGFEPETGKELWHSNSYTWYVCPSVVTHDGIVYGLQNTTCVAVRAGGKGDVTETHTLWKNKYGSTVSSMVYHDGHLYYGRNGSVYCLNAKDGELVYRERLQPNAGRTYGSVTLADGKLFYVSRKNGIYVVAAQPKFEQLAHNVFEDDQSRNNASIVVDGNRLILRTDQYLYCIGKK